MKQYDKIYVPDRNGDFKLQEFEEDYHEWRDVHSEEALSGKENVIVLTIEELNELWKAAQEYQRQAPNNLTFTKYLQSKGINIKEQ